MSSSKPSSPPYQQLYSTSTMISQCQAPSPAQLKGKTSLRSTYTGPALSKRSTEGPDAGPLIERFSCLFDNIYDPLTNPSGIVSLGVAENFLMTDELIDFFAKEFPKCLTAKDMSYGDHLWGSRRLSSALAGFYNTYFSPSSPILPNHLITGIGCSAILDQLFHTLLDEGEGILLMNPYYTGFDRDLVGRGRARLVGFDVPERGEMGWEGRGGVGEMMEQRLRESEAEGVKIKAILICNPHNPLGQTYPRSTLLQYCHFAEEHDLHLVSDEIYAMSVYDNPMGKGMVEFTSMLSLDVEKELGVPFNKSRLHVVHGMSKDFCANGFRIGALITPHNPYLLQTLASTSMLMKLSSPSDILFSALLTSPFLSYFLAENRRRLSAAQAFTRRWFEERGVRVRDANAGHFVWVDLGGRLGWGSVEEEKRGFQRLLDGGVYVAPGSGYHYSKPGWFRITFSVAPANLEIGLARIEELLGLHKVTHPKTPEVAGEVEEVVPYQFN